MLYACCYFEQQGSSASGAKLHAQFSMHVYATKQIACWLPREKLAFLKRIDLEDLICRHVLLRCNALVGCGGRWGFAGGVGGVRGWPRRGLLGAP